MAKTELAKAKKELKKTWQECFGIKLKKVLTEEGLEKFWDEETSLEEATELLTAAGISLYISACLKGTEDVDGIIIIKKKDKHE